MEGHEEARAVFGVRDRALRLCRERFGVKIVARSGMVKIEGEPEAVASCEGVLAALRNTFRTAGAVLEGALEKALAEAEGGGDAAGDGDRIEVFRQGVTIAPKSPGQAGYVKAIERHDLVFCIGPAGCGKTYLAVAAAVAAMRRGDVKKIVLVRPAVEAGEKLGFLPGDIQAKVNPYLRPLYDALYEMIEPRRVRQFVDNDLLEIVPLAYMRGRTLGRAFIILDEAQNCTVKQMKMFLTRLGPGARAVITGDVSQSDLEAGEEPGLVHVQRILRDLAGVAFVYLDQRDIVRHRLVQAIVHAYDRGESRGQAAEPEERNHVPPQDR
jgi:phosphate starvation-inducible PhoH-like protein